MAFNGALYQIFSWLSAHVFFKLCTVCKDAYHLASEEEFVIKQAKNMLSRDDLGFLIHHNVFFTRDDPVELHTLREEDSTSYGVPRISLQILSSSARVLASCNGLLFCRNRIRDKLIFFLCNPATKTWVLIPTPYELIPRGTGYWVVFECNNYGSLDYTLMILAEDIREDYWLSPRLLLKVFSPKENAWLDIGTINRGQRFVSFYHMPIQVKSGTVYFLSDYSMGLIDNRGNPFYWPYIVSFDTKNLVSRYLKLPKSARKGLYYYDCMMNIFKWGGSVCLVQLGKKMFRLWALLNSTESNQWELILKMHVKAMIGRGLRMEIEPTVSGFTVLNGKSLVFATQEKVYVYDLTSHPRRSRGNLAKEICGHRYTHHAVKFHSYSNTLRPCGDGARSLLTLGRRP